MVGVAKGRSFVAGLNVVRLFFGGREIPPKPLPSPLKKLFFTNLSFSLSVLILQYSFTSFTSSTTSVFSPYLKIVKNKILRFPVNFQQFL